MSMSKSKTTLFLLLLVAAQGCDVNPQKTTSANAPSGANQPVDRGDMMTLLQGKWQNERDTSDHVEINGTRILHFNAGKLIFEDTLEVDIPCQCMPPIDTFPAGWCFMEKG